MEKQNMESANAVAPRKRRRFIRKATNKRAIGESLIKTLSLSEMREQEEPRERKRKPPRSNNTRIRD